MLATFLFTMLCTIVLAAVLIGIRYRIETLRDAKQVLVEPAKVVSAHQPEPVR
jgi:hypothetical protein